MNIIKIQVKSMIYLELFLSRVFFIQKKKKKELTTTIDETFHDHKSHEIYLLIVIWN